MECPRHCVDTDGNVDNSISETTLPATLYPLLRGNIPIAKAMLERYGALNMPAYSDVSILSLCKY